MKPIFLEFCGINSFSEPAQIDFTKLLEFGIFGIFGDTGSGKSTVLDCIGFALYGNVDRSRSGSIADIIHYKQDAAYVHFEFEIVYEGRRRTFYVERELKRKNAAQTVRVYERDGAALTALAEGFRESNALLERIIGLEQKDFEKCIALPQGEFAQFVKAQRGERLKLVSRLFDLEAYGERLTKRVKEKYYNAHLQTVRLEEAMKPYAEASVEAVRALEEELKRLKEEETEAGSALARAQEEEKRLLALCEKRREAEQILQKLSALEAKRSEMEETERDLSRLDHAFAVVKAAREGMQLRARKEAAETELRRAQEKFRSAEAASEQINAWDEAGAEAEIERLTELRARAAAAESVRSRRAEAEKKFSAAALALREESKLYREFSYDAERAAIEQELAALGSENFLEYAETHGKAALFRDEYRTFADELGELTEKHPTVAPDSAPLIEKYRALSAGERADLSRLGAGFEKAEQRRRELRESLLMLEKQKGRYDLHLQKLAQLTGEFSRWKEEIADCDAKLSDAPALPDAEAALLAKRREKREMTEKRNGAAKQFSEAQAALVAAEERVKASEGALSEGRARYLETLNAGGFAAAEEADSLCAKYGDPADAKRRTAEYRAELAAALARKNELNADYSQATDEALERARLLREEQEERVKEHAKRIALSEAELGRIEKALAEKRALEGEFREARQKSELLERLRKLLEGNKFMEFVAEEYLQKVAVHASERLLSLTDGRYFLRYDGGFYVGDNFNGGEKRGVYTLSGGETFLVSLSLALALGSEICARSLRPIEFFFLDEGFGTLDAHLIDTVMDSLEKLRGEHFTIGIISHVEELKHRIDRKLLVRKATEQHGSQIIAE